MKLTKKDIEYYIKCLDKRQSTFKGSIEIDNKFIYCVWSNILKCWCLKDSEYRDYKYFNKKSGLKKYLIKNYL